jgi:hypothetical protein
MYNISDDFVGFSLNDLRARACQGQWWASPLREGGLVSSSILYSLYLATAHTRQGKARQGKARQGKARQGKARQGKAVQRSSTFNCREGAALQSFY